MLKHSYAFIIGAGAAKPYDFPTGPELYNQIRKNYLGYIRSCVSNANLLLEERNLIKRAEYFIQELGLTNSVSIDKYININPKFNEHGVCAIAAQIYTCECKSKLPPLCNPETDWYSWLYAKMIEGINSPEELSKFIDNKISFITFNYDRSLEHYLFENLYGLFKNANISREQVAAIINQFEFIHVYGQIGKLPWQEGIFREDSSMSDDGENGIIKHGEITFNPYLIARNAQKYIDVMYSSRKDSKIINNAKIKIESAEIIVFLGFGYDVQNLEILNLPQLLKGKKVIGTALNHTPKEIAGIRGKLKLDNAQRDSDIYPIDCLMLLRNHL